jgi:hypothetical protein
MSLTGGEMGMRAFATATAAAASAVAVLAPGAVADQPATTITQVDRTFTVPVVLAGPFIVEPNTDGTVTVTINGNDGHLEAPGRGSIFAAVGKLVYIADPSDVYTPSSFVQSAGQQDPSQFPATCEGLE